MPGTAWMQAAVRSPGPPMSGAASLAELLRGALQAEVLRPSCCPISGAGEAASLPPR